VVLRRSEIESKAQTFRHPWNPGSELHGTHLSGEAGLERTGISVAVLPPGKESFAYHAHDAEEEWVYLLEGRAVARIDGEEIELEAGDFVAFPTPSVAHQLSNPYEEPVRYLMGGESRDVEVADFPELGRRMVRLGDRIEWAPLDGFRPFAVPGSAEGESGSGGSR
jgi:uncharacterized cupin superfamily protein